MSRSSPLSPLVHQAHRRSNSTLRVVLATCLAFSAGFLCLVLTLNYVGVNYQRPHNYQDIIASVPPAPDACTLEMRRSIAWGAATSAYQIEGAWNVSDKSPSIWDTFAHLPNKIAGNDTGDVAVDHFHRYRQDVALMKALGLRYYRLSLSWPRILPGGGRGAAPSREGLAFYKALLQELLDAGITPVVTLFHWDLPQVLQDTYQGFLDIQVADDFAYYADIVFEELGPYVKHWLTFNEPLSICQLGYSLGVFAPGIQGGDWKMYRCGHHLLVAHGMVVQLYRQKYQAAQGGRISIVLSGHWGLPVHQDRQEDRDAANTYVEWQVGWMADVVYKGDYPPSMREVLGNWLPTFQPDQVAALNGSADFFALNFYTAHFITAPQQGADPKQVYVETLSDAEGRPPGEPSDVFWLFKTPEALRGMMAWIKDRYGNPELWVTENGVCSPGESKMPAAQAVHDEWRRAFFHDYLEHACRAKAEDGVNWTAYFAWSLMDNFEWNSGFGPRFGISHIDYQDDLRRTPKLSAWWLHKHFFAESPGDIL